MFCPQCGASQPEDLKFCKACGTNLQVVTQALTGKSDFDWSKTWVQQLVLSKEELDRRRGITPEMKRYNEMKAGVITAAAGLGVMIFLNIFMQGVILGGQIQPGEEQILSRIWICGIIPFFVGLALIFNGLFVSKKLAELNKAKERQRELDSAAEPRSLRPADTSEFIPSKFSVTEGTTRHLSNVDREQ
jgi:hypothetical protein